MPKSLQNFANSTLPIRVIPKFRNTFLSLLEKSSCEILQRAVSNCLSDSESNDPATCFLEIGLLYSGKVQRIFSVGQPLNDLFKSLFSSKYSKSSFSVFRPTLPNLPKSPYLIQRICPTNNTPKLCSTFCSLTERPV